MTPYEANGSDQMSESQATSYQPRFAGGQQRNNDDFESNDYSSEGPVYPNNKRGEERQSLLSGTEYESESRGGQSGGYKGFKAKRKAARNSDSDDGDVELSDDDDERSANQMPTS